MAWFYVLHSEKLDRYYVGHTSETVAEGLRKHLSDRKHWTGRAQDWQVVYTEDHPDKASAYRREREVKGWKKRSRVEELICASR
ncbi:MAG: GIY-YIG nuclease family protein [Flavobacteriales bacterium]|nr:GIY-YIG nuclease family protein [Flavobacteriales bacterium]